MAQKAALHVLNIAYTIFGLIIACGSIGYFVYINMFVSLRNSNHYLLDYNVYWPQAIPWMFFVCGLIVICTSCCGYKGVQKRSKSMVTGYGVAVAISSLILFAIAIVALACADGKQTDTFIRDTIWDAYFQMKDHPEVAESFGRFEKRLHCCGADSPRDYVNWRQEFPVSCCDVIRYDFLDNYPIDCQFTNKLANERHGCSEVAGWYARIGIKILSGVSIFTALIGIMTLTAAFMMSKSINNRKPQVINVRHEVDSEKVLL